MTGRGAAWEGALDALHDEYRRDRVAWIARCHPPRNRSRTGPPDYIGCLSDGRCVVADAKDCGGRRSPHVTRGQALDLGAVTERGGLALLLVRWGGQPLVVRWPDVSAAWWEGTPLPVVVVGVPFDVGGGGWLAVLEGEP